MNKTTKYTNSPITGESAGEIYRKQKIGEMVNFETLKKSYQKPYDKGCVELGCIMAKIAVLSKRYNELNKELTFKKQLLDILDKTNAENYGDFVDEEKYGIRPEPEKFNPEIITDDMILSYIEGCYSLNKALSVKRILKNDK